jgi:hypothetical protein
MITFCPIVEKGVLGSCEKKFAIRRFFFAELRRAGRKSLIGTGLYWKWGHILQLMLRQQVTTEKGNILLYSGRGRFRVSSFKVENTGSSTQNPERETLNYTYNVWVLSEEQGVGR